MIGLHSFFVILWILPTITNQLPTHASRNSVIDWSGCGTDTKCFCLNDAKELAEEFTGIQKASDSTDATKVGRCNIGVQNKFFTNEKVLVQFQIVGDISDGNDLKLMFYQGNDIMLFGCKLNSESKAIELESDPEITNHNYEIGLFEKRSRFEPGNIVCAIVIEGDFTIFKKKMKLGRPTIESQRAKVKLISHTTALVDYEFRAPGFDWLQERSIKCDPYSFDDKKESEEFHVLSIMNRDRDVLNCDNYENYQMRYEKSGQIYEMKALECVNDMFSIVKEDPGGSSTDVKEPVTEPDLYSFFCAANLNEICKNPITECESPKYCPEYHRGSSNDPATLKCKDNKWRIKDNYYILTAEPVCKKRTSDNAAAFFASFSSGYEIEVPPNARCFSDYDCKKKSKLDYAICSDETKCGVIDYSNGIMKCKNPDKQLNIYFPDSKTTEHASNYTCQASTGQWKDRSGSFLPDDTRVSCPGDPGAEPGAIVNMSPMQMGLAIGGLFIGCILIAVLISVVVYCCRIKRKRVVLKGKSGWLKTKNAERIAIVKDLFTKVTETTMDTNYRIVHGFNLLDLLMDTETMDAKNWDEVHLFLLRFQGAIEKLDNKISKMFTRYLFLQAKKIIDKHGWLSEQPITNKDKHKKGLMRSFAIRLLGICFNDSTTIEPERFALWGFSKLRFKVVEEYPHCGELWALMFHDHTIANCKDKDSKAIEIFDRTQFTKFVNEIAFNETISMLDEDIIPEFGSPSDQAAFALGGSLDIAFHRDKDIFGNSTAKGSVHLQYLAGMGASIGRNPVSPMMTAFGMRSNTNVEFLESLKKIAKESDWNNIVEKTMKIMVYYGRALDAKRLQVRFMPKVKQPSELYKQIKFDQTLFEEAVENQKDELRKWFAARTDKEALKTKPVYIKDAAIETAIYAKLQKDRDAAIAAAAALAAAAPAAGAAPNPAAPGAPPAGAAPAAGEPVAAPAAPIGSPLVAAAPDVPPPAAASPAAVAAPAAPLVAPAAPPIQ